MIRVDALPEAPVLSDPPSPQSRTVEVGTVGGGTRLPCQREALQMIGCLGDGKSRKLAEIVAATVLAGELSTLAAQAAGQLGSAHAALGR